MLAPIVYKAGTLIIVIVTHFLIMFFSYMMVGLYILREWVSSCFVCSRVETDSESETGSESVSEGGAESPRRDLSGNEISLLQRENEALQDANRAWFERVEKMEKEKRHANQQCCMIAGVCLMLLTVYAAIIYVHLLKKKCC